MVAADGDRLRIPRAELPDGFHRWPSSSMPSRVREPDTGWLSYSPRLPSSVSRTMSAWPACRAVSSNGVQQHCDPVHDTMSTDGTLLVLTFNAGLVLIFNAGQQPGCGTTPERIPDGASGARITMLAARVGWSTTIRSSGCGARRGYGCRNGTGVNVSGSRQ